MQVNFAFKYHITTLNVHTNTIVCFYYNDSFFSINFFIMANKICYINLSLQLIHYYTSSFCLDSLLNLRNQSTLMRLTLIIQIISHSYYWFDLSQCNLCSYDQLTECFFKIISPCSCCWFNYFLKLLAPTYVGELIIFTSQQPLLIQIT